MDLDPVVPVDEYVEYNLILFRQIRLLHNPDLGVLEPFLGIIVLDDVFCLSDYIWCQLLSRHHSEAFCNFFFLIAFHSLETHFRHSRLSLQRYFKPCLVTRCLCDVDLYFRIEALTPESLDSVSYRLSGNVYTVSYRQTGKTDDKVIVRIRNAGHIDSRYFIRFGDR